MIQNVEIISCFHVKLLIALSLVTNKNTVNYILEFL